MAGSAPDGPLVAAEDVVLRRGGRHVLRDVDAAVRENEILTVVGPNGAGKSTLIRVLLGLVKPDSGRVRRRPGLAVGYLPQSFDAAPALPLSVRRLLALAGGRSEEAMLRALREAGAEYAIDRPVSGLSGGERQRVLLARALLRDPDLLVLDEPVQNVDLAGQLGLYERIAAIRERRRCGVVMISHDLHVVMAATDRVLCLNTHVCCSGPPEAVGRHPEYLALFGPRASGALAVYAHRHDHAHDAQGGTILGTGGSDVDGSDMGGSEAG